MSKIIKTYISFLLIICFISGCMSIPDKSTPKKEPIIPPVELKIEVFDRGIKDYDPTNNFLTKYCQDNFGTPNNIKLVYIAIPRTDEISKLKSLMTVNDAPDIIFTYDGGTIFNFVTNNLVKPLNFELNNYGSDLKVFLKDTLKIGEYSSIQYTLPAKRVLTASVSSFIRKDWLEKLNLKNPTTIDEFYYVLKQFKEKDPGNLGDKNIPFAINPSPWHTQILTDSFITDYSERTLYCYPQWLYPGYKEGIRFINKLYNEGLLNQNFSTDVDKSAYNNDIKNGNVGAYITDYDKFVANKDIKLDVIDPFINKDGKTIKKMYSNFGFQIMIPKYSKRTIEAIKYLNWMSKPEVIKILQNGKKGIQYREESDSIPKDFISIDELPKDKKIHQLDMCLIANGKEFLNLEKNIIAASIPYKENANLFIKSYKVATKDAYRIPVLKFSSTKEGYLSNDLNKIANDIYVKSIITSSSNFDNIYDNLVDNYMKSGGQEILDEKLASYDKIYKIK